ncbi:hypothetical protein [Staphylococcus hominis]|uniref:hypothetical protein n=1 Tax=Staphylococcus hominis TaxID=1290 RepID=UPI0011AAC134|nr:hypothetical protein [Staphylococcus hominis]
MGFKIGSTTKYKGVIKKGSMFEAQIRVNGKYYYLGRFINERDAAKAYNNAINKFGLKRDKNVIGIDNRRMKKSEFKYIPKKLIKYLGVYKGKNFYYAKLQFNNRQITISNKFKTPEEAAIAYNIVSTYLKGMDAKLNNIQMTNELSYFEKMYEIPDKIKALKQ